MNFNLIVKEVVKETFLLTGEIEDNNILENLKKFIKNNKDEELSKKTHVKGHFTGFQSLIQNDYFIQFLEKIKHNIKIIYKGNFLIKDAWGNILNYGEEVTEHEHNGITAFSGILYLSEGGPGTYFKDYNLTIEEKIGRYVLFSPILYHSVKKVNLDLERITVAWNSNEIKDWDNIEKIKFINKNEI
jgi:hypothetical protein